VEISDAGFVHQRLKPASVFQCFLDLGGQLIWHVDGEALSGMAAIKGIAGVPDPAFASFAVLSDTASFAKG
jgi:hypothetical protein